MCEVKKDKETRNHLETSQRGKREKKKKKEVNTRLMS
jgi:hypothetical protein